MQRLTRLVASIGVLVGCSCGGAASEGAGSRGAASEAPRASTTSSAVSYSVHEWGLVHAGPGDTLSVGALGPSTPSYADMVVEKPVIYFHLAGGSDLAIASVTVDASPGDIREHWPHQSTRTEHGVTWAPFHLRAAERCATADFAADNDCAALDPGEACETPELARAVAGAVACPTFGALQAPFLFYRARTRALTVPLAPHYLDFGDINVTNDGDLPIPGRLIRFERTFGQVRVVVVDPPAPHETILVGHDYGGPEVARAAVMASFAELGLAPEEASAFLTSWDEAFFGSGAQERSPTETPVAEEIPLPETSILYFLPVADVDRLARLTFDPAPTEVRRAMAVWTTLR